MGTVAALAVKITGDTREFDNAVTGIGKTVDKAQSGISGLASTFGGLAKIAGAIGIGRVVDQFIDSASALSDMSAKTGIAVRDLQKFQYAGELVGISLEQIASSATMLQNRLAGGDKSAAAAVQQLGLSVDSLLGLNPAQQLETVAGAIAKIPDPAKQAAIAMDVFGRSGATLLPLIRSDIQAVGDEMERLGLIMSDEAVAAGDRVGDMFTRLKFAGMAMVAQALDPMARKMEDNILQWRIFMGIADKMPAVGLPSLFTGESADSALAARSGIMPAGLEAELNQQIKERQQAADEWQRTLNKLSGREAIKAAADFSKQVAQIGGAAKLAAKDQQAFADALWDSVMAMQRMGQGASANAIASLKEWVGLQKGELSTGIGTTKRQNPITGIWEEANDSIPIIDRLSDATMDYATHLKTVQELAKRLAAQKPPELLLAGSDIIGSMSDASFEGMTPRPGFFSRAFGGAKDFSSQLSGIVLSALTGGGDIGKSLGGFLGGGVSGQLGSMAAKAIGGTLGSVLGSVIPGIGTVLGGLVGGLFSKLFGPTEYEKRVRAESAERQQIVAGADMASLQQQAAFTGRGDLLQQFLNVQNSAAPQYLKDLLTQLETQTSRLQAAMDRYGISWEQLGEKAKQSQIDQMAQQFVMDFQVLSQAGVDTNLIIEKMSGSVNEFVQTALRTGTEVPIAMQPMLQKMLEMGLLTDASGQKLMDLSSIQFSQTMTQGFQSVVDAINHLTRALGYEIPAAAQQGAAGINAAFDSIQPPDLGGAWNWRAEGAEVIEAPGMASGGYVPPRSGGTLVRLGEGGEGEHVVPESQMGGVTVHVHGSLIHQDELGQIVANAAADAIRTNRGDSYTRMSAALGI